MTMTTGATAEDLKNPRVKDVLHVLSGHHIATTTEGPNTYDATAHGVWVDVDAPDTLSVRWLVRGRTVDSQGEPHFYHLETLRDVLRTGGFSAVVDAGNYRVKVMFPAAPRRRTPNGRTKTQIKHLAQEAIMDAVAKVRGYYDPADYGQELTPEEMEMFRDAVRAQADRVARLLGYEESWSN